MLSIKNLSVANRGFFLDLGLKILFIPLFLYFSFEVHLKTLETFKKKTIMFALRNFGGANISHSHLKTFFYGVLMMIFFCFRVFRTQTLKMFGKKWLASTFLKLLRYILLTKPKNKGLFSDSIIRLILVLYGITYFDCSRLPWTPAQQIPRLTSWQ